jgi:DNA integrity scanning protein DisA with diadenylate cyclase activity
MNRILDKAAAIIVRAVATMWCALFFAALALVALPSALHTGTLAVVSWISQTFIQLVMLSIIMVGQRQLDSANSERHTEIVEHHRSHTAHLKHLLHGEPNTTIPKPE